MTGENPLTGHEPEANQAAQAGPGPLPDMSETQAARQRLGARVSRNLEHTPPLESLPPGIFRSPHRLSGSGMWLGLGLGLAALACLVVAGLGFAWINRLNRSTPTSAAGAAGPLPATVQALAASATAAIAGGNNHLNQAPQATAGGENSLPQQLTPAGVQNLRLVLFYDPGSLYVLNASGQDVPVNGLAFELLDAGDKALIRVEGRYWGQIYNDFRAGFCIVSVLFGNRKPLDPAECQDRHLIVRTPAEEQNRRFWVARDGASQFRVLWQDREAGRCPVDSGACEVFLP